MTRDGMLVRLEAARDGMHPEMPIVDVLTADGETCLSKCRAAGSRAAVTASAGLSSVGKMARCSSSSRRSTGA